MKKKVIIVGGGAAGIFTAVICAQKAPHLDILVLEKTEHLLSKVKLSGGGRCNVTHAQFDPKKLISNYPRGGKELLGPFHRFQPQDTIRWFEEHKVALEKEEDGRIFPATHHSSTIVNCLLETAREKGVRFLCKHPVSFIDFLPKSKTFRIHVPGQEIYSCDFLVLATGGSPQGHTLAHSLGHRIIDPVPSLFALHSPNSPLTKLAGITLPSIELSLPKWGHKAKGSLLLTHFGLSGPAALKLSSLAARDLHEAGYRALLHINWVPGLSKETLLRTLLKTKEEKPTRWLQQENLFSLPLSVWKKLLKLSGIETKTPLSHTSKKELQTLAHNLTAFELSLSGKTTHKAEFVTCGGVCLKEVDFKTMQSKLCPHLFFVGELLDIDGVTGGFNFQNAWTTGYIAASAISEL